MRAAALVAILLGIPLTGCFDETDGQTLGGIGTQTTVMLDRQRISLGAGGWALQPFYLTEIAAVHYTTESRNDDSYDVCIIDDREGQFWKDGNAVRGWACHSEVTRASDGATVGAGGYYLAFRCRNYVEDCILAVSLQATG